jgi:hypothetical protein
MAASSKTTVPKPIFLSMFCFPDISPHALSPRGVHHLVVHAQARD